MPHRPARAVGSYGAYLRHELRADCRLPTGPLSAPSARTLTHSAAPRARPGFLQPLSGPIDHPAKTSMGRPIAKLYRCSRSSRPLRLPLPLPLPPYSPLRPLHFPALHPDAPPSTTSIYHCSLHIPLATHTPHCKPQICSPSAWMRSRQIHSV